MTRKTVLLLLITVLVASLITARLVVPAYAERGMNVVRAHAPWPVSAAAQHLHDSLIIGDWHADSLLWDRNLLKRADYGQVDFPRLREGNVAFQVFTAVTKSPSGQNYHANATDAADNITLLAIAQTWPPATWNSLFERALYQVGKLKHYEEEAPEQVRVIRSRADIEAVLQARASGQPLIGALMGMEGAHPLQGELQNLTRLYDAGYRLLGITHFFDNELGGSLHGESRQGLTPFGREVVRKATQLHMIIDLAHASPAVVKDVLAATQQPLVLSHTGIHSRCPVERNIDDQLMQAIAATGGVIGIGYWQDVLCDDTPAGIVQSIRAAVNLVGEDHVSLGSDFDGSVTTRLDTSELAAITSEMLRQGFSETTIRKVMGGNMVRVLQSILRD